MEAWPEFQNDLGFLRFSVDLCFLPKARFMFLMVSDPDYGEDRKDVQPIPSCLKPRNPEKRSFGNVRSFIGNYMRRLRGGSNLASWVVARTLAYFLWVKPSHDLRREEEIPLFISF